MTRSLKLCALLAAIAIAAGCASKQDNPEETQAFAVPAQGVQIATLDVKSGAAAPQPANPAGQNIVSHARRAIGTPYVLGGSGPGGFDCSGLVKWAYNRVGVELPRTAREQSTVGHKIQKVEDMRAGDIVAFRHPKRGYHTGIYVGDGKFIHSPRKRSHVKINSLSEPYFNSTLLGARRVSMDGSTSLVAQAESNLETYLIQRSQGALASRNAKATASIKAKRAAASKGKSVRRAPSKQAIAAKKDAKATLAKNAKNTKAVKAVASKSAKAATKTAAKQAGKKTAGKTVAQNAAKARATAAATKKPASRTVSMLRQKTGKTAARSRSHS